MKTDQQIVNWTNNNKTSTIIFTGTQPNTVSITVVELVRFIQLVQNGTIT